VAGPATILHGDTHPGNVYVLPEGTVGLLDWQLMRRGSWVHDVAYAMVSALSPDDRRRNERELLQSYLDELIRLGVSSAPSWDAAWQLYRASPPWGWVMWVVTPDVMYSPQTVEAVIDRFAQAFCDLDTLDALGL
jgi:aminoglycoside phosphotransferase (APT) family kinase protein